MLQPNRADGKNESNKHSAIAFNWNISTKRKIYVLSIQLQFSSSIEAFRYHLPAGSFEICQKHSHTHTMAAIKIHSMAIKPAYRQTKPYQINRSPSQAIGQEKPPKTP